MRWVLALLCLGLACGEQNPFAKRVSKPGKSSSVHLSVRAAVVPDALKGSICDGLGSCTSDQVGSFSVTARSDEPPQLATATFDFSNGQARPLTGVEAALSLDGFAANGEARVTLWGISSRGVPYSVGRSAPFAIPEEGDVQVPIFMGVANGFSAVKDDQRCLERFRAAAVALPSIGAFVVGGEREGELLPNACLFDRKSGEITLIDAPRVAYPAAVAVGDDRVLIAGGIDSQGPVDKIWLLEGGVIRELDIKLPAKVYGAQAAWFAGPKKAVILGGLLQGTVGAQPATDGVTVISLDEPRIEATTLKLSTPRAFASATLLVSVAMPAVVLVGGVVVQNGSALNSAETLFQETDGSLKLLPAANTMSVGRVAHMAAPLEGGAVFIFGGSDGTNTLQEPAPAVFSIASDMGGGGTIGGFIKGVNLVNEDLAGPRVLGDAVALPDGSVLVVGGAGLPVGNTPPALLFSPSQAGVLSSESILELSVTKPPDARSRAGGIAVELGDGTVLVAGGFTVGGQSVVAEIFVPCSDADAACPK